MTIRIAISPCPNDTFIFAALINDWIDHTPYEFEFCYEDIQTLNEMAIQERYDIIKISYAALPMIQSNYSIMDSGSALGFDCGPLLISKQEYDHSDLTGKTIAVPGEYTSAHALLNYYLSGLSCNKRFVVFSEVEELILNNHVDAGVIIHENRFTYIDSGLIKIVDLGTHWEKRTQLPVPLGGPVIHKRLHSQKTDLEQFIKLSLQFAHKYPDRVLPFCRQYAQEMENDVMMSHINLYVNEFSLHLGHKGKEAIQLLNSLVKTN